HYVDQLTSRSADMPIRWIDIDDISGAPSLDADEVRLLVRSIVDHGIVSPLLVRREGGQYRLIAGRKRLAAARVASLSRVPCLVHQIDDAQAEALARAENIRIDSSGIAMSGGSSIAAANVMAHVSEAVATIQSA